MEKQDHVSIFMLSTSRRAQSREAAALQLCLVNVRCHRPKRQTVGNSPEGTCVETWIGWRQMQHNSLEWCEWDEGRRPCCARERLRACQVATFLEVHCGLPEYSLTAERNLSGAVLHELEQWGQLTKACFEESRNQTQQHTALALWVVS
eukprot:5492720-Amphidinium_carterae.1